MDTVHHHSISHLHQQIHSTINNVLRSVFNEEENEHSFHLEEFSLTNEDNSHEHKANTSAISENDSTESSFSNTSTFETTPKGDNYSKKKEQQSETYTNFWNCFCSYSLYANPKCSKVEFMLRKANLITQDILIYLTKNDISKHIMKQQTSRLFQYYLQFTSSSVIHCL